MGRKTLISNKSYLGKCYLDFFEDAEQVDVKAVSKSVAYNAQPPKPKTIADYGANGNLVWPKHRQNNFRFESTWWIYHVVLKRIPKYDG